MIFFRKCKHAFADQACWNPAGLKWTLEKQFCYSGVTSQTLEACWNPFPWLRIGTSSISEKSQMCIMQESNGIEMPGGRYHSCTRKCLKGCHSFGAYGHDEIQKPTCYDMWDTSTIFNFSNSGNACSRIVCTNVAQLSAPQIPRKPVICAPSDVTHRHRLYAVILWFLV